MYDYRNGRRVELGKYFCKLLTLYLNVNSEYFKIYILSPRAAPKIFKRGLSNKSEGYKTEREKILNQEKAEKSKRETKNR